MTTFSQLCIYVTTSPRATHLQDSATHSESDQLVETPVLSEIRHARVEGSVRFAILFAGVQLALHVRFKVVEEEYAVLDGLVSHLGIRADRFSGGRDQIFVMRSDQVDIPETSHASSVSSQSRPAKGCLVNRLFVRRKDHGSIIIELHSDRSIREGISHSVLVSVIQPACDKVRRSDRLMIC
jgi:hypothetical protein